MPPTKEAPSRAGRGERKPRVKIRCGRLGFKWGLRTLKDHCNIKDRPGYGRIVGNAASRSPACVLAAMCRAGPAWMGWCAGSPCCLEPH